LQAAIQIKKSLSSFSKPRAKLKMAGKHWKKLVAAIFLSQLKT
jgi:hypothetical protein